MPHRFLRCKGFANKLFCRGIAVVGQPFAFFGKEHKVLVCVDTLARFGRGPGQRHYFGALASDVITNESLGRV